VDIKKYCETLKYLKKDIYSIKCFIEKALTMAMESTQTTVERDYNVTSL